MSASGTSQHPHEGAETSPAFVLLLDREGRILFLSHVEEVHVEGEAIGSSGYACFSPESQAVLQNSLHRVFQERSPADCELISAWGQHVSCRIALLNAERAIVICADITERKRAEEALQDSQKLISAIVENIPDMIFVKDAASLRFVRLNKAGERLLGYRSDDLLGKSDYDFFPEEEAAFFTAKDREVLQDGGVLDIPEESIATRTQGKRILHTRKVPILSETGEPQYLLGISADITEQKRAEQERRSLEAQVQQAQKLESLGVLAGGIAHDFNNLLCGILMNADLVKASLPPGSDAAAGIEGVLQSTLQAAALTRQMLAYAGKGAFAFREVDLNSVVMETRSLIQTSLSKKAMLACELGQDLGAVEGDASQLRQIVMNLVLNASEALGDKPGTIRIETANARCDRDVLSRFDLDSALPEGRYVRLSVSDSGCGMDAETRAKVFDPFFSTKFAGRGLGLAAMLGIVRSHKGGSGSRASRAVARPSPSSSLRFTRPPLRMASTRRVKRMPGEAAGPSCWSTTRSVFVWAYRRR